MALDLAATERKRVWTIFASSPVNKELQKRLQAHAIVLACLPLVSSGEINASKETLAQVSTAYPGVVMGEHHEHSTERHSHQQHETPVELGRR